MKTNVHIGFNGDSYDYIFEMKLEDFLQKWNNQLSAVGYFSGYDQLGQYIVINPSQCGIVEITVRK